MSAFALFDPADNAGSRFYQVPLGPARSNALRDRRWAFSTRKKTDWE